jgi:hypothetical protein
LDSKLEDKRFCTELQQAFPYFIHVFYFVEKYLNFCIGVANAIQTELS